MEKHEDNIKKNNEEPSRRKFIKTLIGLGAGAVLGGGVYLIKQDSNKTTQQKESYNPEWIDKLPPRAFGMDISHHNTLKLKTFYKEVQLKKLNDGIDGTIPVNFVYIRIGQGMYNDKNFKKHWNKIKEYNQKKKPNKLKMAQGIYYFYKYHENPTAQADNFINMIKKNEGDLGQLIPMIDVEKIKGRKVPKTIKEDLKKFIDKVDESLGIKVGIYSGLSFFKDYLDGGKEDGMFHERKHRIANYKTNYNDAKKNIENKLGHTPAIIQWNESVKLPGTGNSKGHTDVTDTENLPELFIKNNFINNKDGDDSKNKNKKDIDTKINKGTNGDKLGGIIGGSVMAISCILHYSRNKKEIDRRTFFKKAITAIAVTIGGALTGALVGSQIEKYSSLDMKFEGISKCTITLDDKEIILYRNILATGFGMTVQVGGKLFPKIPIENRKKIEDSIAEEFDGFSFSNRDRKKILKNMKLIPNEEDVTLIAISSIFSISEMPYTAETYNSNTDWRRQQSTMNDAQTPLIETKGTNIREYNNLNDIERFTKRGRLKKVEDIGDYYYIRTNQIPEEGRRVLNPDALTNMKKLFELANIYLKEDFDLNEEYHVKYPIHSLTRHKKQNILGSSKNSTHFAGLAVDITTIDAILPKIYKGNLPVYISEKDKKQLKTITDAALYKAANKMKEEGTIIPNIEKSHLHIMLYTGTGI